MQNLWRNDEQLEKTDIGNETKTWEADQHVNYKNRDKIIYELI